MPTRLPEGQNGKPYGLGATENAARFSDAADMPK
jgi:hypothetical protein